MQKDAQIEGEKTKTGEGRNGHKMTHRLIKRRKGRRKDWIEKDAQIEKDDVYERWKNTEKG